MIGPLLTAVASPVLAVFGDQEEDLRESVARAMTIGDPKFLLDQLDLRQIADLLSGLRAWLRQAETLEEARERLEVFCFFLVSTDEIGHVFPLEEKRQIVVYENPFLMNHGPVEFVRIEFRKILKRNRLLFYKPTAYAILGCGSDPKLVTWDKDSVLIAYPSSVGEGIAVMKKFLPDESTFWATSQIQLEGAYGVLLGDAYVRIQGEESLNVSTALDRALVRKIMRQKGIDSEQIYLNYPSDTATGAYLFADDMNEEEDDAYDAFESVRDSL